MNPPDYQLRRSAAATLMAASGFAALAYQIIWTLQCALWLGHESAAVLAVVSAFFGGLALGGLALGKRIEASSAPRRWYVGCELVIALWSPLLLVLWSPFSGLAQTAMGLEPSAAWLWWVAFFGTFVLLLPATAAMGATLPAMERLTAGLELAAERATPRDGRRSISALYAANTFGAVFGVLASTFWLVPRVGLARTSVFCAGLNLFCAALAFVVFPKREVAAPRASVTDRRRARGVSWRLALAGFLGIGYEMLVVRVLSQVTENTVYTFALLLAVYLVGTALGAAAYRQWLEGRRESEETSETLFVGLSVACLLGAVSLWGAQTTKKTWFDVWGETLGAAIGAEAALALLAFALPTVCMGALFSHLCGVALGVGVSFGRAAGVNLLAAAIAPPVFGVLAVPFLGAKFSLLLVGVSYLAAVRRTAWTPRKALLPVVAALGIALLAPPLRFVDVPAGGNLVVYREGVMAAVSVVEEPGGALHLRINNRQQEGSSVTRYVDARQAWLPLLLHPEPRRALFLGLGTGVTASAASEDPNLQLDAVELLPEVIESSVHFSRLVHLGQACSEGRCTEGTQRVRIVEADARRYVRLSDDRYDVIVADNFHPARSGSGSLYTVEHFAALQARLAPGGLLCQWLPLHQLDLETLRSIVRSFTEVYPRASAILASNSLETPVLGLVARGASHQLDRLGVRVRLGSAELLGPFSGLGFDDEYAVMGSFVAGPRALGRFAAGAPLNTDDHPVVAYRAPLLTYAPDSRPSERLLALLSELSIEVDELFPSKANSGAEWTRRLAAYWVARDRYLEFGQNVRPAARVEDMLARVQQPLLEVLRISPDFRPAYDPLFGMATALARSDVAKARELLAHLNRLQPARPEAAALLSQLQGVDSSSETIAR